MTYDPARGRIGQRLATAHCRAQRDSRRGMQPKILQESRSSHQETTAQIAEYLGTATTPVNRRLHHPVRALQLTPRDMGVTR